MRKAELGKPGDFSDINSERYKAFLQNNEHLNIKALKQSKGTT